MSDYVIVEYKLASDANGLDDTPGFVNDLEGNKRMIVTKPMEQTVNELIAEGWQPFGSPFSDYELGRSQAMVVWGPKPLMRPSNEALTNRS